MCKDWTETTLGEIAEVNMGQSPPGDTYNTEGIGLPFMQGSAEFGEHYPETVKFCSAPAKIAEIGDLLLSVRAPVGDSNFANQRIAIGRGLATVRARTGADTHFLRLVIQQNTAGLLATSGTGMFSSITGKNLREFGVNLPPLVEQKRIVDMVSSVDAYIDALQQQVDSARTARNAVLHELLSAGGEDWTETTLGDIAKWSSGKNLSSDKRHETGLIPILGANGIIGRTNEVLLNEELVTVGRVGACGETHRSSGPVWISDNALIVIPTERVTIDLLFYVLSTFNYQSIISGTTQPLITQSNMKSQVVNLPPLAEQKRIVEIVSSMDDVIQSTEKAVVDAKSLRSGLLSDLLSGEHEIPTSYDSLLGAA
jgi:type I restriction enzyme S subunit